MPDTKSDPRCAQGEANATNIKNHKDRMDRLEGMVSQIYNKIDDLKSGALQQVADAHARTCGAYEKALMRWPKSAIFAFASALTVVGILAGIAFGKS